MEAYDRGFNPAGLYRQLAAIVSSCDRTEALGRVRIPVLVIHGSHDRFIHVSGGKATARALPDAKLLVLPGMGHDLQVELWPVFTHGIEQTAESARAA
jgi:pimeloyl-ACP methyl ester carboxylesterase